MKKIQMVDLLSQYNKIEQEINEAVINVIKSSAFINGPEVKLFASELQDYLHVKHVIPCGNGTDSLQVSMMALNLKPGDEVITTTFTFIATAEVIALLGLTPVLVDVCPDTFNMDPEAVKKAITPKTKAIVPVHLFGQCAEMETLLNMAKEHNLYVIEDTCQAIGAEYTFSNGIVKKAGTMGTASGVSFFPSKNLGCYGDGGAVFTDDDELAEKLRMTVNHGMKVRYYHDAIGVNSRLDSIQAAILRIKLRHLDEYIKARQIAAGKYNDAFAGCDKLVTPYVAPNSTHVFHQYTLVTKGVDRNGLHQHLMDKNVPCAIYYPVPLHKQKAYLDPRYKDGMFPVSEMLCDSVISLPMHTELDDEQIKYITDSVLEYVNK
ncbi:MAG: DegT/DnrJ/EryC1/StrS family aminotransferase [Bacteroidales bacterium]|nr:DegT/DnrJ/EryC1/StrS family aminotransferase [Bacteroidales bacterium]